MRSRRYVRWENGRDRPDICLLNEDLPAGAESWVELCQRLRRTDFPVIRIGMASKHSDLFEGVKSVFVKRPVLASRVLKALDELVTDVYHFAPELAIHDDMPRHLIAGSGVSETHAGVAGLIRRILVVDDSESVRKMMEVRLAKEGFEVDFAETGEEALIKARERPYDLIFLDVMLPGINGYDVSRQLKKEIHVQAPVVMLTGKTSRIDKLRGSLAHADGYLTKPLAIGSLDETLHRYLK
ncbi:response regulator [Thiocystis violacea]|uniref:response regulator n=1 Tax=Thiocystis violacea TaxID=13725 RepID=UPI001908A176